MVDNADMFDFYKTNMILKTEYGFIIDEIEGMFPFERVIYINLINTRQKEKAKNESNSR